LLADKRKKLIQQQADPLSKTNQFTEYKDYSDDQELTDFQTVIE